METLNSIPRILMVGPVPNDLEAPEGGVEAVVAVLGRALAKRKDVSVEYVSPASPRGRMHSYVTEMGRVHSVPCSPNPLRRYVPLHQFIERLGSTEHWDVLHSQGFADFALGGHNRVLTVHGLIEEDLKLAYSGPARHLRRASTVRREAKRRNAARNVISISEYVAERLGRNPERRVWNIRNPVSDTYMGGPIRRGGASLLFAGRIIPRKDLLTLVAAFRRVVQTLPEARLRIVGTGLEGSYGGAVRDLVRQLDLIGKVEFTGAVGERDLAEVMRISSCLVLASRQETAPMVVAEALATGLPVVATSVGGVRGMVAPGGGIVVPPADPEAMAEAILVAIGSQTELSKAAISNAKAYRADLVAQQTMNVYRQLAKAKELERWGCET
jgi:glycosyltransferase involved in cell wall biosynthesis